MVSLSKPGLAHPPNHKTDFVLDVILQRVNPNLYHSKCYQLDPKKKNLLRRRKIREIENSKKKIHKKFLKLNVISIYLDFIIFNHIIHQ